MTSGEHYNQLTVQDYNGDGKAEVALLTADGTTVYAPTAPPTPLIWIALSR